MAEGDTYATGDNQTGDAQSIEIGADGSVLVPEGHSLSDAGFEMLDGDLVMSWSDGSTATVEGFADSATSLVDSDGAQMSGDMAQQLAQIDAPPAASPDMSFDGIAFDANGTDMIGGTDGAPIGNVEDLSGSVFAVRVDGTRIELNVGDPVFQGDILESGPDGSIGVILADETTFSMGEEGRMVLDEMIYDPGTQEGTVAISVLEGVFTFVSGQVAKTDPDAMTLDTPVATIGIRGTQVGINLGEGKDMEVVLMEEGDGFVGEVVVQNDGGVVILNQAFAGTSVGSFDASPGEGREVDRAEFLQNFGSALKALPGVNNANTYGVTEQNLELMIEDAVQQLEQDIQDEAAAEVTAEEQAVAAEEAAAEEEAAAAQEAAASEQEVAAEEVVEEPQQEQIDITLDADPVISALNIVSFDGQGIGPGGNVVGGTDGKANARENRNDTVVEAVTVAEIAPFDIIPPARFGDPTTVQYRDGGGTFTGSDGVSYRVFGGAGGDRIITADGDDYIYSRGGNDVVNAGAGDDIIVGGQGAGDDIYEGGTGVDWVIYPGAQDGYDLLINAGTQAFDLALDNGQVIHIDPQTATDASDTVGLIDTDTLINIENVLGGQGDDIIVGTDGSNILAGGLGSDMLFGGDGDDILVGGNITDFATLESAGGYDGHDTLIGGAGFDTAMFSGSFGDYTVNIDQNNQLTITGPSGGVDTLIGIEEMRFDNGEVISVGLPPVISVLPAVGDEDTAIALNIDAALADGLGALSSITISDIPEGSVISIGTDGSGNPITVDVVNGVAVLTPDQLVNAAITPPVNFGDDFALSVTAEREIGFTSAPATLTVNVSPVADAPDVTVSSDNIFVEGGQNATFDLSAVTTDTSENISEVQVSGIPDGAKLFIPVGDGSVTVQLPVINGVATIPISLVDSVIIQTAEGYNADYDLVVSATSKETDGGDTATTSVTVHVDMQEEPVVTVQVATGDEDTAIPLDITAVVDGGESITSIIISDIPDGAVISVGTDGNGDPITVDVVNGEVVVMADQLANLSITPPADDDTDFALSVVAVSTDGGVSDPVPLDVTVVADADAPTLGATDVSGAEDTAIALDISAALTDLDGSETLSDVTLSGIPDGAVISVGTDGNGNPITVNVVNGTVSIPASQLGDLAITPPADFNGTLDLSVSVTTTEIEGDTATTTTGFTVTVNAVDDVPVVTVTPATGDEDTAIPLDISAVAGSGDVAFITIDGIPDGAVISIGTDGTGNPITVDVVDGMVSLTPDQLTTLTITPAANDDTDLNLTVTATSQGGLTSDPVPLSVDVAAVADAPVVSFLIGEPIDHDRGHGNEPSGTDTDNPNADTAAAFTPDPMFDDPGSVYPLTITAALSDVDGSETLSVNISGVPDGVIFNAGTDNGDGTWTFTADELSGDLQMFVPVNMNDDFSLSVNATATEGENADTAVTSETIAIDVMAEPDVDVMDATGAEDTAIVLDISAVVDGGESLESVTISDIPEGAVISVGADAIVPNADGSVTLNPDQLANLTVTPPANSADDFNLQVSATSTDGSASDAVALAVTVAAVADTPVLTLDIGTPAETEAGQVYPVTIDTTLVDTDSSESLSVTITLVNAPDGVMLSAGTNNGDGTWTLEPQQLDGLELTVPEDATMDFALEVTATSTEMENQDTATATQSAVIDLPGIEPGEDAIVGTEDSDVLTGTGGDDEIWGMGGHDLISGQGGDDEIRGGEGSDALFGGGGNDALFGDAGSDLLWGGGGNDVLNGGADQDYLSGGGGDDTIIGGTGDDYLRGGGGADTFIFDAESGSDIIKDIMEQDSIVFEGQEFHAEDMIFNENEEGNVEISFQNVPDTKVTLEGVKLSDFESHANDGGSGGGYSITETDGNVTITLDTDG